MREFWPELATTASWEKLLEINREFDFVLIGGWAVYIWTGAHKSKDIDILVDHKALSYLKERYELNKNARLRKYEIKLDRFDIDIYVPFFSRLAIPVKDLIDKYSTVVKGIKTVMPEALLILKQSAEIGRRGTPKGMKDGIDLVTLAMYADIDWRKYHSISKAYGLGYSDELIRVINDFNVRDIDYLGIGFKQFRSFQKNTIGKIKQYYL